MHIVLLLTHTHLSALAATPHGAKPLMIFMHNSEGEALFARFAADYQHAIFYLLTDLVEEDFQFDLIPHLSRKDQSQLLKRKLDQLFRATPYRRAVIQGKKEQQDRVQISALTSRELIDRIVADLNTARCALQGVYSVALLTEVIVKKLRMEVPHLLLMSSPCAGTLRQSYFTLAGLQFSRLGAFDAKLSLPEQDHTIASEIRRARQYLSTLRLMNRDDVLHVFALFGTTLVNELPAMANELSDDHSQIRLEMQSVLPQVVSKLKLPKHCISWHDILVATLIKFKVQNQYAPVEALHYSRLRRLAMGMQWVAISVLILVGILAGFSLYQAEEIQREIQRSSSQLQHHQQRLRQFEQLLSAANAENPQQIQAGVDLYTRDLANWPSAEASAQRFSQVFSDFPALNLQQFQWQVGGMTPNVAQGADSASQLDLPRGAQRLTISGRVVRPDAYRQALSEVSRLANALRQWPSSSVKIVKYPLDIRPETALQMKNAAEKERIDFVIQVDLAANSPEAL